MFVSVHIGLCVFEWLYVSEKVYTGLRIVGDLSLYDNFDR